MPTYATIDDYSDWASGAVGTDDTTLTRLLRQASSMVARETANAVYQTDPTTNLPTDPDQVTALREATCAQVETWLALGITNPAAVALDAAAPKNSKGIGSARITYDTGASSSTAALASRQAAVRELCDEAQQVLRDSQLLTTIAWTYG